MTDVPGTTRDLVTEVVDIGGLRVTLVDTAGLRATADVVESEGVARAERAQEVADLVLFVLDRSVRVPDGVDEQRATGGALTRKVLYVANKSDLSRAWCRADVVEVSALTGEGIDVLRARITGALDVESLDDPPPMTNVRHIALVQRADEALRRARGAARCDGAALSEEFVLADLQDARGALEEISGRRAPDDLLAHIFSRFCIGK